MTLFSENLNALWSSLLVEELVRNKITRFCISPGSRSTPLTGAVARHPQTQSRIFYDERAAAYFAVGFARATGVSAPLICTSGTAVANYLPGVVEASIDFVPMIILSADRPPELHQTGANQTIQQQHIFGNYLRWQFGFPAAGEEIPARMVLNTIDQAVYRAHHKPAGPVHLNFMFREPLAPLPKPLTPKYFSGFRKWEKKSGPFTSYFPEVSCLLDENIEKIAKVLHSAKKRFVSVGQLRIPEERAAVLNFINRLNCPWYADITSGLRLGTRSKNRLTYFDLLLQSENFQEKFNPGTILHLGGQVTSKRYLQYLEKQTFENFILVRNNSDRYDPVHVVTHRIESDLIDFCVRLGKKIQPDADESRNSGLRKAEKTIEKILRELIDSRPSLNEPWISRTVSRLIHRGSGLFLANSLPIREMDWFGSPNGAEVMVAANRGASGIDGNIASASGFAAGLKKRTTLLIGDLAFIHDLNSLYLVKKSEIPLQIILINNGGGGIFSFLPIARFDSVFEKYFATPHTLKFKHAADLFGLEYASPQSAEEFAEVYSASQQSNRSIIIEINTERKENFRFQKNIQLKIVEALNG